MQLRKFLDSLGVVGIQQHLFECFVYILNLRSNFLVIVVHDFLLKFLRNLYIMVRQ